MGMGVGSPQSASSNFQYNDQAAVHVLAGRLGPAEQNSPRRGVCCARSVREDIWVFGVFVDEANVVGAQWAKGKLVNI